MTARDQLADRIVLVLDPDALDPTAQEAALAVADAVLTTVAAQLKAADELEAAMVECCEEIDAYIRQEYPHDHLVQERYRQRDFAANPARQALTAYRATKPTPE